jgi:type IV pilus assembly protein PilB
MINGNSVSGNGSPVRIDRDSAVPALPSMSQHPLPFSEIDHISAVIAHAYEKRASDLHFEPGETKFHIRMRQDGMLSSVYIGAPHNGTRLSTQVKVMANLDITEQRIPQDGRITFTVNGAHNLDIRVSTCPTAHGEKIVLRLLDPKAHVRSFAELGMEEAQCTFFREVIDRPSGLILVTGPAGSGKTTTLYSALAALNNNSRNIATIEDPVEITLAGINQVTVFPKLNLSFARVLRSLMRQDPDVIMIGEIREQETAEIAIQAAQTGHLVLSTLHSSRALEAINRLVHMGIPRYELLSTLQLVIAQRLLRTQTTGRIGVFELLPITAAVRKYVLTQEYLSSQDLLPHQPIMTLQAAAAIKVKQNIVSQAEVNRVVPVD